MEQKKIYRIEEGKMVAGVCGGVAEYFDMDVTIVRIIWAVVAVCWGIGIAAYIICALLLPKKPSGYIDA